MISIGVLVLLILLAGLVPATSGQVTGPATSSPLPVTKTTRITFLYTRVRTSTVTTAATCAFVPITTETAWMAEAIHLTCPATGDKQLLAPVDLDYEKTAFAHYTGHGEHLQTLQGIEAKIEGPNEVKPITGFEHADLHPVVIDTLTRLMKYRATTPIQAYAVPAILAGGDVVGISQTGSGKTAAYLAPIISKLMGNANNLAGPHTGDSVPTVRAEPLVVVIVPTRELAVQVAKEAEHIAYRSMLRTCVIYGGSRIADNVQALQQGCDILVGTPGRLADFMGRPKLLSLNRVLFTVIDEADEMLKLDWETELDQFLADADVNANAAHSYVMMSATFPGGTRALARKILSEDHTKIRVGRVGSTHSNIDQEIVEVEDHLKRLAILALLQNPENMACNTLIFVNNKRTAELLDDFLYRELKGIKVASLHADLPQASREMHLNNFRSGEVKALVVSGLAARGMDLHNVQLVVNYDMPSMIHGGLDEYVNRIGRTGRMGHKGKAVSFYNDGNSEIGPVLTKLLVENKQPVPECLAGFVTEGPVEWDDRSDSEEEGGDSGWGGAPLDAAGDDASWGGSAPDAHAQQAPLAEAVWGGPAVEPNPAADAEPDAAW